LVDSGRRTIDEIPEQYREEVQAMIDAKNAEPETESQDEEPVENDDAE
jgi:hypothetical protein